MKGRSLLVALLLAITLGAPASAQERTGALKRIADTGTVTIGFREESPPFSSAESKTAQPKGYSIDVCMRVVEGIKAELVNPNLKVRFLPVTATDRFDKVGGGAVDLECGNSTVTLSRMKQVDFSNLTFITGGALLVGSGSPIRSIGDLGGKKVSVVTGTTTETALRDVLSGSLINATIVPLQDHEQGLRMVEKGEVDAHAGDQIVLIGLARAAKDASKLALAPDLFSYEPLAITLPRNDADFRLVVNRALAQLYRSGDIGAIYSKWFGDWGGRPAPLLIATFQLNSIPE